MVLEAQESIGVGMCNDDRPATTTRPRVYYVPLDPDLRHWISLPDPIFVRTPGTSSTMTEATRHGLVVIAVVVSSLSPVVPVLLGVTVLHERVTRHRLVGAGVAIALLAIP